MVIQILFLHKSIGIILLVMFMIMIMIMFIILQFQQNKLYKQNNAM